MRLVAWNCAGGFAKKQAAFLDLDPDLAVLSEAGEAHANAIPSAEVAWTGRPGIKGLAIVARKDWKLERLAVSSQPHLLAVKATRRSAAITLVGVWTLPVGQSYVRPLLTGIDELAGHIAGDVIVAGDFNANVGLPRKPNFEVARRRLADHALDSLWHARSGEAHGAELTPTHYWKWKHDLPFHLDYIFATPALHARCRGMQIGAFDDWVAPKLSDHVPLIADFAAV